MPRGLLRDALLLILRKMSPVFRDKEVCIRTFGVGLLALAALAAVGLLLTRRRRPAGAAHTGRRGREFDDLYAAGL